MPVYRHWRATADYLRQEVDVGEFFDIPEPSLYKFHVSARNGKCMQGIHHSVKLALVRCQELPTFLATVVIAVLMGLESRARHKLCNATVHS